MTNIVKLCYIFPNYGNCAGCDMGLAHRKAINFKDHVVNQDRRSAASNITLVSTHEE